MADFRMIIVYVCFLFILGFQLKRSVVLFLAGTFSFSLSLCCRPIDFLLQLCFSRGTVLIPLDSVVVFTASVQCHTALMEMHCIASD